MIGTVVDKTTIPLVVTVGNLVVVVTTLELGLVLTVSVDSNETELGGVEVVTDSGLVVEVITVLVETLVAVSSLCVVVDKTD